MRPKVRYDGLYICKMKYFKSGLSDCSMYNPVIEVNYYRYIRFKRNGETMSIFTVHTPKKIFHRIRDHFMRDKNTPITMLAEHNPKEKTKI